MRRSVRLFFVLILIMTAVFPLKAANVQTISLWAMGVEGQNIGKLLPQFEAENPGIKVKLQVIPWSAANDRLLTAVAGGTVPDLTQMGSTYMAQFTTAGALEDLSPYLAKSNSLKLDDFFPACRDLYIVDGKPYGIPWYADTRFFFYRTDILEEVGYKEFPDTWDEFIDCCRKLRARGPNQHAVNMAAGNWQVTMNFIWANGGRIFDEEGRPAVTEEAFVEAVAWLVDIFKNEYALLDTGGSNIRQELANGRLPIFIGGFWEGNLLRTETPHLDGKWSIALMPMKKSRASFMGGCGLVIFKRARQKEAAWKLIEFLSRPEIQNQWREAAGSIPANIEAMAMAAEQDPLMKIVFEQLKEGVAPPVVPQWPEIEGRLNTRIQEACYGVRTPLEACQLLAKDLEKIMADY
ncbi:MAG: sugar ABC transporter substrate-binding protein [Firmicutes bacterium]|nr:sugar ABC transporter substrate-binding protein [Bacillota bacterium]